LIAENNTNNRTKIKTKRKKYSDADRLALGRYAGSIDADRDIAAAISLGAPGKLVPHRDHLQFGDFDLRPRRTLGEGLVDTRWKLSFGGIPGGVYGSLYDATRAARLIMFEGVSDRDGDGFYMSECLICDGSGEGDVRAEKCPRCGGNGIAPMVMVGVNAFRDRLIKATDDDGQSHPNQSEIDVEAETRVDETAAPVTAS
jgi:hypothetical protein